MRGSLARHLFATATMLAGSGAVFFTVWVMNAERPPPEKEKSQEAVNFKVEQKKPPKKKKKRQKQTKRRKADNAASKAPPPSIQSSISASAIGLPEFDLGTSQDVAKDLLGDTNEKLVMADGSWDVRPSVQQRIQAEYPDKARQRGVEGFVKLSVFVSEAGSVERIKVLGSEPRGVFEDVAKEAVGQWSFSPGQYQGQAVSGWVNQTVRFKLTKS